MPNRYQNTWKLQRALWTVDKFHLGLIYVSSLGIQTRYGLHLNLEGEERLVNLIANRIVCKLDNG